MYRKEKLQISDREVVSQIEENPYWQYFLGYEHFTEENRRQVSRAVSELVLSGFSALSAN